MSPSPEPAGPPDERFAGLPDPGQAGTLDDLVERLRLLKVWAGEPSFAVITQRINAAWTAAGRPAGELARRSTVVGCFQAGRRRLNAELVIAVVRALHPDEGYVAQWRQALRVIGGETEAAAQVRVHDTLPPDPAGFTGRGIELDRLRRAMRHALRGAGAAVVCAIEGMAGVGKTQLAIHAAHLFAREEALDRVLFVNLRGFHPDPAQPPADPAAVLDGFLRLLGVAGHQIPHEPQARAAAYRARLDSTRTLIVLDNAADADQIRPLLPTSAGCLTLVTSRRSLADLPSVRQLAVDVFGPDEAVAFLTGAVPQVPVGTDPLAAVRIAQRCGCLPLALSLVAAHIRGTPGWTLTDHADRLDERHRQRRLDSGVDLALDLSHQRLTAGRQRLLRLVALHPGQDFDEYAAAALAAVDLPTAQDDLHALCQDHLLQRAGSGRYTMHDLIRAHAAGRAADQDPPPHRRAALTRLFDFYVAAAAGAMEVAYPYERHRRPTVPPVGTPVPDLADQKQADVWLDTELANLLATARLGRPEHTWQLSALLDRHLRTRGRHGEAESLHRQALALACRSGNRHAEMVARDGLGYTHWMQDRNDEAGDEFGRALRIAQDIGDRAGQLHALNGLGHVHAMSDRDEQAGELYEQALRIAQDIGDRGGELAALAALGDVHSVFGRYDLAASHHERALRIAHDVGDRVGELYALTSLGDVHLMVGRHEQGADHHERALQIAHDIGNRAAELSALHGLAEACQKLGDHRQAADRHRQTLELARELGDRNWQFEALQGLGRLHHATGRPDLALAEHEQALHLAGELVQLGDQARAHDGLAHAHRALGDHAQARHHWQRALDILDVLGTDHTGDAEATAPQIRAHLAGLG